jgi:hypothetical protein
VNIKETRKSRFSSRIRRSLMIPEMGILYSKLRPIWPSRWNAPIFSLTTNWLHA